MTSVITLQTLGSFAAYLLIGIAVWGVALAAYFLITRHREFALIRLGNTAAAVAFGGAAIGVALPVSSAIRHSVSLLDALVWGAVAVVFQLAAYGLSHLFVPNISRRIEADDLAAGIFLAGASIAIGLMNAAAMTP